MKGKGVFLWQSWAVAADDDTLIARLLALKVNRLEIKSCDGAAVFRTNRPGYPPQVTRALVDKCHAKGIEVWTWQYAYGKDPIGEARVAAAQAIESGADGHIIDAESEFLKQKQPARKAGDYLDCIHTLAPDLRLAFCSFALWRHPRSLTTFWSPEALSVFLEACDFAEPMAYHYPKHVVMEYTRPDWILKETLYQYRLLTQKPIVPAGKCYENSAAPLMPGDMETFARVAHAAGCPSISFWSLQHITPHMEQEFKEGVWNQA